MKRPWKPLVPDYTPKGQKKDEPDEVWLKPFTPCLVCGNAIKDGPYGRYTLADETVGNTCSRICTKTQSEKPKYEGYPKKESNHA